MKLINSALYLQILQLVLGFKNHDQSNAFLGERRSYAGSNQHFIGAENLNAVGEDFIGVNAKASTLPSESGGSKSLGILYERKRIISAKESNSGVNSLPER
jgi:hypothetical protein